MENTHPILNKIVTAKTMQGGIHGTGKVIVYCAAPTVIIERYDGSQFSWRADLCEVQFAPTPEEVPARLHALEELVQSQQSVIRELLKDSRH